jgi:hypothetical protein
MGVGPNSEASSTTTEQSPTQKNAVNAGGHLSDDEYGDLRAREHFDYGQ